MSMYWVNSPIALLHSRNLYHVFLTRKYWDSAVYVMEEAMQEFRFGSENVSILNERNLASKPRAELK